MKKKLLALLLTLVMLLSLSVPALAADDVRETDFFEDQEHSDTNFEDMEYVAVDVEAMLAAMNTTRTLAEDTANLDTVREGFLAACDLYTNALTMYCLAQIYYSQDFAGEGNADRLSEALQAEMDAQNGLYALGRDILNSPCAAALDGIVNEEDAEYLRDYEDMTEEEKALEVEITDLEDEYQNAAFEEYSVEVNGVTWTENSVLEAYYMDELSYEDAVYLYYTAIPAVKNAALGEIYLRIVDAHKREAAMEEYEFYDDYAYEIVYQRDYTPVDAREFHAAVKEYMAPVYQQVLDLFYSMLDLEVYYGDFSGDIALDLMDPCIASMSSELYEAFRYMRDHGLYDSGISGTKDGNGFTITLPAYGAPFFFNTPTESFYDFTTAVHEFGHYNNAYWMDDAWYHGSKSKDISEVHSQALELFFTDFYPELLGEGAGDFAAVYILLEKTSAIVEGALYDELQQFVYETEGVTLQQINEKYAQLCEEYGLVDPRDWVEIPHTFTSPCYYISYAVSAVCGFDFWLKSQEDYFAGVDDYLRFTAQKMDEYDLQEGMEVLGYPSPISTENIAALAEELVTILSGFEAAIPTTPTAADVFTDVDGDEAWYDAVSCLYDYGILNGVSEDTLDPDGSMTRAQASTVLCRLFSLTEAEGADYFPDVTEGHWYTEMVNAAYENDLIHGFTDGTFRPGDAMSRQDFAVLLYNIFTTYFGMGFEETWSFDLGAADAEAVGGYALEAVSWGVKNGYFGLDENACLRPADELTRAEMAEMVYYAFFTE